MADQNLVNYINQLLQSGYDINTIRNQLLSAGYNPAVVEEAVNYVYQPAAAPGAIPGAGAGAGLASLIHNKKLLFIIAGIMGVIILSLITITVVTGPGAGPISLSLSTLVAQVEAGNDFEFVQYVENLGDEGPISFSYRVIDSTGNQAATDSMRVDVSIFSPSSSINIPPGTAPGSYTLMAKATYAEQTAESTLTFVVLAPPGEEGEGGGFGEFQPEGEEPLPGEEEEALPTPQPPQQPPAAEGGLDPEGDEDYDGVLNLYDFYKGDRDNDGIIDSIDIDNDNDGTPDDEDQYPFDFDNDGILDKDDNKGGRAYEIPEEQGAERICRDDYDCNDYDICTTDLCDGGECKNIQKASCCGNSLCESAESPASCPSDCAAPQAAAFTSPYQETIDKASQEAKTNKDRAIQTCLGIPSKPDSETCISDVAKASNTPTICSQIEDEDKRDACYMYFAMNTGDFSVCKLIIDRYIRNSCFMMETLFELQEPCNSDMDCNDQDQCTSDSCSAAGRCQYSPIIGCT